MKGTKVIVVLWAAIVLCSTVESNFLDDFHTSFSTVAKDAGEDLEYFRGFNSDLIEEFNRELLLSFAVMVPTLRAIDAEFVESLENLDNVTEECLDFVMEMRALLVELQNRDIQNCAFFAFQELEQDTKSRFWPYHNPFAREFVRATTQVIQTLGRNRLDLDEEAIKSELDEELVYFANLQAGQWQVLYDEIAAHADMADMTYRGLEGCREFAKQMQQYDHEYLEMLMEDCLENGPQPWKA